MDIRVEGHDLQVRAATRTLLSRTLSPMTGLSRAVGFVSRGATDPRVITAGAELTGVHVLLDRPDPGPGRYHIGGSGLMLDEALIRCVGETVERYTHFVWETFQAGVVRRAGLVELTRTGETVLDPADLDLFSPDQFAVDGFPFAPFDPAGEYGWVQMERVPSMAPWWVPAQAVLVGYRYGSERRATAAVTTGTAAHTDADRAMAGALLEIAQIDAAIGHWYSPSVAPRILPGRRTVAMSRLVERHTSAGRRPAFHLLRSPDLPGFFVACLVRGPQPPTVGIGLGAGLRLESAMYKALLEAVGTVQLAKKGLLERLGSSTPNPSGAPIYDLENNVLMYASGLHADLLDAKFPAAGALRADELPADVDLPVAEEVDLLVEAFGKAGHPLYRMDLTTADVAELGFTVCRLWSPRTLSLPLPSAPPLRHPRFAAYGGSLLAPLPHPYP